MGRSPRTQPGLGRGADLAYPVKSQGRRDGGQLVAMEMSHLGPFWRIQYSGEALDQAPCPGTQEDKWKSSAQKGYPGTSLVVLWLRLHLPTQGT